MGKCILGIQVGITSGCAVYYEGEIVFAVSEERFAKVKNETKFPELSIECAFIFLKENNYPLPDVVVMPTVNMDYNHYLLRRECTFSIDDYVKEQHDYYYERLLNNNKVEYRDVFPEKYDRRLLSEEQLERLDNSKTPQKDFFKIRMELAKQATGIEDIVIVNHELAHAAYGLYSSPINKEESVVVAVDGFGDEANCSIWTYENTHLVCHKKYINFNIGRLYRYVTLMLGMKPNEHEYKVMGLAPYAPDVIIEDTYDIFNNTWYFDKNDGEVKYHELPTDSYFYFKNKFEGKRFDAIAGALQKYTEKMLLDLVDYWTGKLEKEKVIIAGGVSLNIKANMHIGELDNVADIYVPSSGGDESLCIGAIFGYLDNTSNTNEIRPQREMYLGNEYNQSDIDDKIKDFTNTHSQFQYRNGISNKEIAVYLAQGNIIGRFVGRMEFGARALGNRSILASPKSNDIVRKLNAQIKHRDFWMPFTPSIIDYKEREYLINPKNIKFPFMTIGCRTTPKAQDEIIGALHPADFSARPQIVTKESNNGYWVLINEFCTITGIGALLNTSLNLHGLPICESAEDVFNVLLKSNLDMAVLGTTIITRKR